MTPQLLTTAAGLIAAIAVLGIGLIFGGFRSWGMPANMSLFLLASAIALSFSAPTAVFCKTRSDAGRIASIGLVAVSSLIYIVGFGLALLSALIGIDERVSWTLVVLAGTLGSMAFLSSGAAQIIVTRVASTGNKPPG